MGLHDYVLHVTVLTTVHVTADTYNEAKDIAKAFLPDALIGLQAEIVRADKNEPVAIVAAAAIEGELELAGVDGESLS